MTILFGRSAEEYSDHWRMLLQSFIIADNWEEFNRKFPGMTLDWSEGERKGYVGALAEHAHKQFGKINFTEDDAYSYLRKCDVHFKRSRQRILQNDGIVPFNQKKEFRKLTDTLTSETVSVTDFKKTVGHLERKFPGASPWLAWHLKSQSVEVCQQI